MSATSETIAKQEGVPEPVAEMVLKECQYDPLAARAVIRERLSRLAARQGQLPRPNGFDATDSTQVMDIDLAAIQNRAIIFNPAAHRRLCRLYGFDSYEVARVLIRLDNDEASTSQILSAASRLGVFPSAVLDGMSGLPGLPGLVAQAPPPEPPYATEMGYGLPRPLRDYRSEIMGEWWNDPVTRPIKVPARVTVDRQRAMQAIDAADEEFGE